MTGILDDDDRTLDFRMILEARADEPAVPVPFVLGVRRGVNADERPAVPNVALEGRLLSGFQNVARSGQENNRGEPGQMLVGEVAPVLRVLDAETVLLDWTLDHYMEVLASRESPATQGKSRHDRILSIDVVGPETVHVKGTMTCPPR